MNKYLEIFERIMADYGIEDDDSGAMELHAYLQAQGSAANNKPAFTEIGLEILSYLQDGHAKNNKAKDIAEGMGLPSKKISGAMRKLVTDDYVEKYGQNPVIYSLTEKGENFDITSYKETLNNEEKHD